MLEYAVLRFSFIVESIVAALLAFGIIWAINERIELRRDAASNEIAQPNANYLTPAVYEIPATKIETPSASFDVTLLTVKNNGNPDKETAGSWLDSFRSHFQAHLEKDMDSVLDSD